MNLLFFVLFLLFMLTRSFHYMIMLNYIIFNHKQCCGIPLLNYCIHTDRKTTYIKTMVIQLNITSFLFLLKIWQFLFKVTMLDEVSDYQNYLNKIGTMLIHFKQDLSKCFMSMQIGEGFVLQNGGGAGGFDAI